MLKRSLALVACTFVVILGLSAAAEAHVTVQPKTAEAGSTVDLEFRVPNESEKANTTEVKVVFPADRLPSTANAPSHTGWTASIDKSSGAVASVTWSGGKIPPNANDTFVLTTALPKDTPSLKISVLQTYDDGTVARWIDDSHSESHAQDAHPAPVVSLTGSVAPTTTTTASITTTTLAEQASDDDKTRSTWARYFIIVGVVFGLIAYTRIRKTRAKR